MGGFGGFAIASRARTITGVTGAESAWLFRHALLRDAACQLQLPGARGRLHGLAFRVIEDLCGGPPPEPPPLDAPVAPPFARHGTDPHALDLARHAREALASGEPGVPRAAPALYLRRAAEIADRAFRPEAEACWLELAALLEGAPRGAALLGACEAARQRGRPLPTRGRCEEALALFRRAGNRRLEGRALGIRALIEQGAGQVEAAERSFEEALAAHREAGDRGSEGVSLGNLAMLYRQVGRVEQAERTHEKALAIHREVGNRRSEGVILGCLAIVYQQTGRAADAERAYDHALEIHREVGNRREVGITLGNLATLYRRDGRVELAERIHREALAIGREVGNLRGVANALGNLANILQDSGRHEQARRMYEQALEIGRDVGDRSIEGLALGNLAILLHATGCPSRVEECFGRALEIFRGLGHRRLEGEFNCSYATFLATSGRPAEARERWEAGTALLETVAAADEIQRQRESMRALCARAGVPPADEPAR